MTPRYAEKSFVKTTTGQLHLVASKTGRDGSIAINQDADMYLARLGVGDKVSHPLLPNRHAWLHVAEGEVNLNGEPLKSGDGAAVSAETLLEVQGRKPSQILLFDLN